MRRPRGHLGLDRTREPATDAWGRIDAPTLRARVGRALSAMRSRSVDILVMGAGLQGTGVALELARRGRSVVLLDQDERALNRASLRNEGKIHLGFIYANDRSLRTALLQIEGALRFRRIVARWAPDSEWMVRSTPFHYLVARDSVVPPSALAEHYAAVEANLLRCLEQEPDLDY